MVDRNGGHWRHFERPTIELDATDNERIHAVNSSPPFQGPQLLAHQSAESFKRLHRALKRFADLADDPNVRFTTQLKPGEAVVFDNRRVLHARTAFEWDRRASGDEPGRWVSFDNSSVYSPVLTLSIAAAQGLLCG